MQIFNKPEINFINIHCSLSLYPSKVIVNQNVIIQELMTNFILFNSFFKRLKATIELYEMNETSEIFEAFLLIREFQLNLDHSNGL
jgi:hypothetical protein